MDSPVTLRLDKEIRERVARLARQKRMSTSQVIREAIESWIDAQESAADPYENAADLIGVVRGGNPKRSQQTGLALKQLLRKGRRRS